MQTTGIKEWDKTYGGSGYDFSDSVQQTNDGGYIVVGFTMSYGSGTPTYDNVWLIKLIPEYTGNISIDINGGFRISAAITNTGTLTNIP